MNEDKYKEYENAMKKELGSSQVFSDILYTRAFGADASFYQLRPKVVLKVSNGTQAAKAIAKANELGLSVCFKAAGTSLSGQAVSDSILIMCSRDFDGYKISKDAKYISVQPALRGARVNEILAKYGKKIGPDPASINAAMIGGIAANNASGMCCGTAQNSYKTMHSIKLIFKDGTRLDTACTQSKEDFKKSHAKLLQTLLALHKQTLENKNLTDLIKRKFKLKNTCGYSINAIIDYSDPFDILAHLIIGSEGTLAFIEEITYETITLAKYSASSMVYFNNIEEACKAISALKLGKDEGKLSLEAAELMDRASLKSIEDLANQPDFIKHFDEKVCALLIQTTADDESLLDEQIKGLKEVLSGYKLVRDLYFSKDAKECKSYWDIRSGMFPSVGAMRPNDTSVIIEDITFPVEKLSSGVLKLQELFKKYSYNEAIIFGHAFEGNVHFVFAQNFSKDAEIKRYQEFLQDIVKLVAKDFKGSLKAEHGTGRNMAGFVEFEWGKDAYALMRAIKDAFDPKGLLNPDVIISDDPLIHLKNLKEIPAVNKIVDKCTECGFCEHICPSRDLTLTPRQRVVINRAMQSLRIANDFDELKELQRLYKYAGIDTCAACSLCSTLCPLGIDNALLTKQYRHRLLSQKEQILADKIEKRFTLVLKGMRGLLKTAKFSQKILGTSFVMGTSRLISSLNGHKTPLYTPYLPGAAKMSKAFTQVLPNDLDIKRVVYFPSCLARNLGQSPKSTQEVGVYDTTMKLLDKAGLSVVLPKPLDGLCCGMPFSSKGYKDNAKRKSDELEAALLKASDGGKLPILCETSPCVKTMLHSFKAKLNILEPASFALKYLVPRLDITPLNEAIALHITCSTRKMGLMDDLINLAKLCAKEVIIPQDVTCCGFAGDKGFNLPALNDSALKRLKKETSLARFAFSTSKTCEIGLSSHSKLDYNSILYLLDECSKEKC